MTFDLKAPMFGAFLVDGCQVFWAFFSGVIHKVTSNLLNVRGLYMKNWVLVLALALVGATSAHALDINVVNSQSRVNSTVKAMQQKLQTFTTAVQTNADAIGEINNCGKSKMVYNSVTNACEGAGASKIDDLDDGKASSTSVFLGNWAGRDDNNGTWNRNTGVGIGALMRTVAGTMNTGVGYRALEYNTANGNTAVGMMASYLNQSGTYNTSAGMQALYNNRYGSHNTVMGYQAQVGGSNISDNVAIGAFALKNNSFGAQNVAVGKYALENNSSSFNVAVGYDALGSLSGMFNTAIGFGAGNNITSGTGNIIIGSGTTVPNGSTNTLNIGNMIYGNNSAGIPKVGIGAYAPGSYRLFVNGNLGVNGYAYAKNFGGYLYSYSDKKWKKNIRPLENSLEKILSMQGVSYEFKVDEFPDVLLSEGKQVGLIAQEVEAVFPELVQDGEKGKSVNYSALVAPLIEAVKALNEKVDKQQAYIEELEKKIGSK